MQSGNGHQMAETRNAERGLVGVAQIFAAADQQSGQQSGFAFRKGTLHRISAEPCDPLRRKAQAVPLGVQDLELHRVVLLVGRIRARDIAALGRLIRRTVKAAERVRHIKRDRGTHPVSCQQWRFGFRQVAAQAKPPAVCSLRREQHALVGVVHLGIPQGGCGDLLRFAG